MYSNTIFLLFLVAVIVLALGAYYKFYIRPRKIQEDLRRNALERAAHVTETTRDGSTALPRGAHRYLEQLSQQHSGTVSDPVPGYCLLNQVGHFPDDIESIDSPSEVNEREERGGVRSSSRPDVSPFSLEPLRTPPSAPFGGDNDEALPGGRQAPPSAAPPLSGNPPAFTRVQRRTGDGQEGHARLSDFPRALRPPVMEEGVFASNSGNYQEVDEEYFLSHPENFEPQDNNVTRQKIGTESASSRVQPSSLPENTPRLASSSTTLNPFSTSISPSEGRETNGGSKMRMARLRRASSVYGTAEYANKGCSPNEEDEKNTQKKSVLSDFSTTVGTKQKKKKKNRRQSTSGTSFASFNEEHVTVEFGMLGEV